MKKVHLVTDGCYSDYSVIGAYSTKERAEEARLLYATENEVEEYELDVLPEHPPGLLMYSLFMDGQGNSRDTDRMPPGEEQWMPCGGANSQGWVRFHVWARDEQHALKIANEKRTALIASGEWTTDWKEWCNKERQK